MVWTEDGFYNASANGDQYVGWHVNKGPENSAEYYNARQFRKYLYRPDVIKNALDKGSSSLAVKEAGLEAVTVSELSNAPCGRKNRFGKRCKGWQG